MHEISHKIMTEQENQFLSWPFTYVLLDERKSQPTGNALSQMAQLEAHQEEEFERMTQQQKISRKNKQPTSTSVVSSSSECSIVEADLNNLGKKLSDVRKHFKDTSQKWKDRDGDS